MSENVVVRCPICAQKYRVTLASVGHRARCKKCRTLFAIQAEQSASDDDIVAWITDDDPSSASVMGSTGIFQPDEDMPEHGGERNGKPLPAGAALWHSERDVHLRKIDADGAHFEFPVAALANPDLRNSFSRKCVGCGLRAGLRVHLIYWPERMLTRDAPHWKERMEIVVGKLLAFKDYMSKALLDQLPRTRHIAEPFNLPFPVFTCEHCEAARNVETHVITHGREEVCRLHLASLGSAVSFFRNNGGRESPAYQRLIEERDLRRDPWKQLNAPIRQRIAQWFAPAAGEHFVQFFADPDFSPLEAGKCGLVLTDQRMVYRKHTACRDYPLEQEGRLELVWKGDQATVHIYERGQPPAVLKLDRLSADQLTHELQKLHCPWTVVQ